MRVFLFSCLLWVMALGLVACTSSGGSSEPDSDGDLDEEDLLPDGDTEAEKETVVCYEPEKTPAARKIYSGSSEPTGLDISPGQQLAVGSLIWRGTSSVLCTATLITDRVALASAHCIHDSNYDADVGEYLFVLGEDAADPLAMFDVRAQVYHPSYEPYGMDDPAGYDVALIFLQESVFDRVPQVTPIVVNQEAMGQDMLSGWQQSVGYGTTENDHQNTLKYWIPELLVGIRDLSFEVDGRGIGSVCYGDSGGPSLRRVNGELRVFGTVSWGDESCRDHDHYARLDSIQNWMLPYLEQDPVSCGSFPQAGLCDGNILKRCENDEYSQTDCRGLHQTCGLVDGLAACVDDPCEGLGSVGECRDNKATWCEEGSLTQRDCPTCGQDCAYLDHTYGIYCVD